MIGNIKTTTHWRKTYPVEAVRLTPENMEVLADFLGTDYHDIGDSKPYILVEGLPGYIGDWLFRIGERRFEILPHEEFLDKFQTHSEQMTTDEKYAKVFQHITSAMHAQDVATYHGDTNGMDIVAIQTAQKIAHGL
jgi:hypothetical protein